DAEILPGELGRVLLAQHPERAVPHPQAAVDRPTGGEVPRAVHRVVAQEMSERVGVGDVVDGHELQWRLTLDAGAHDLAADSPEAVDADAKSHGRDLLRSSGPVAMARPHGAPQRGQRGSSPRAGGNTSRAGRGHNSQYIAGQ